MNVHLAKIVKKRYYGNAFIGILKAKAFLYSIRFKIGFQALINVDGMIAKSALIGRVKSRRRGSREKVGRGREQIFQELIRPLTLYVIIVDLYKFLF
jgi:hypothetical protein